MAKEIWDWNNISNPLDGEMCNPTSSKHNLHDILRDLNFVNSFFIKNSLETLLLLLSIIFYLWLIFNNAIVFYLYKNYTKEKSLRKYEYKKKNQFC